MGIRLEDINDPRLRDKITRQLCHAPTTGQVHENTRLGPPDEPKNERDLHDQIEELCRQQGWYYVHSRMDRATTVQVGAPDFIIALPKGVTVWLECKKRGSKPTLAQNAALAHLLKLDHAVDVIYDLDSAKEAVLLAQAMAPSCLSVPELHPNTIAESSGSAPTPHPNPPV